VASVLEGSNYYHTYNWCGAVPLRVNLSIDSGGGSLNGPGYKNAEFDKEQMRSYPQELVILGDAELNAFFHLLGINSKIVD
jgi:hypothetical protein